MFNQKLLSTNLLALTLILQACSFSHSSESSSESSGSLSDLASSPSSLSSSHNSEKFESDVEDYTFAYLKSSSEITDYAGFQKGLSKIAEERGVNDWENEPQTYRAIGKALKKAQIDGVGYETFKKNFANGNRDNMEAIQDGYDSQQ